MNTILVVLNSRKQTWLLYNLLISFVTHTKYPERLKICINIDNDDVETQEFANFAKSNINLNLIFESEERSFRLNDRINSSFNKYISDFNWALNTDVCIRTENWDSIIDENNKENVLYINDDGEYGPGKQYCFFPILSKKIISGMKTFFPTGIYNLGADVILHQILDGFNIIKHIPISVWHYKYHNLIPHWIKTDSHFVNDIYLDGNTFRILKDRIRETLADTNI